MPSKIPETVPNHEVESGNGVTGTPSGHVGFDTEYKAFTFDGNGDSIQGTVSIGFRNNNLH